MNLLIDLKKHLTNDGKLKIFPSKRKYRLLSLFYLSTKFDAGRIYTEKEVNEIIDQYHIFNDKWLLRRELIVNKFMNRKTDCSNYWLEENQPKLEDFFNV